MKPEKFSKEITLNMKIFIGFLIVIFLVFLEISIVSCSHKNDFWTVIQNIEPLSIIFSAMAFWIIFLTLEVQNKINISNKKNQFLKSQEERLSFILHNLKENYSNTQGKFIIDSKSTKKTHTGNKYYQWLWSELRNLHNPLKSGAIPDGINYFRSVLLDYLDKNNVHCKTFISEYPNCDYCHFTRQLITIMSVKRQQELNLGLRTFNSFIKFLDKEYSETLKYKNELGFEAAEIDNIFINYLELLKIVVNDEGMMCFLYFNIYLDEKKTRLSPISHLLYSQIPESSFIENEDYKIIFNSSR
jgi:hypothetical protein